MAIEMPGSILLKHLLSSYAGGLCSIARRWILSEDWALPYQNRGFRPFSK